MMIPAPFRADSCRVDKPGRQIIDFGRVIIGNLNCPGPCEDNREFNGGTPNRWQRGQSVRVGWVRNGHGLGGAVRWSIVNVDKNDWRNKQTYAERTFHVECFVQTLVDCGGQCGTDTKRYESNLKIPNSLPDGRYRLQWVWFGGPDPSANGNFGDYYNCVDVVISGGPMANTHNAGNMPTCYTIGTKVGDCAQEPCRTGEPGSFKKINEIPDGKVLGSSLWGGSGSGGGNTNTNNNNNNNNNNGGGNSAPGPFGRWYPLNGRTFNLHPIHVPDLCLDATATHNGADVTIFTCHGRDNQKWTVRDTGNGIQLINKQSGKALDIDAGNNDGQKAQVWDTAGSPNQRFHVRDLGGYEYGLIVDQGGSRFGLDVAAYGKAPGTKVQQWTFTAATNQRWVFTAA